MSTTSNPPVWELLVGILRSFLVRHTGDNEDTHMGLF